MDSSSLSAREYFSAALAPLQIDFVSEVSTKDIDSIGQILEKNRI